jgi:hypothetical protein
MVPSIGKIVTVIPPQAIIDNAAATTNVIDTLGFDYLELYVCFGAMDIAVSAMKIQEAEVAASATALTSGADITASIVGTAALDTGSTSALPSATADNTIFKFEIDLRGRMRYLDLVITLGDGSAGTFVCAYAILDRAEQVPVTAAQKGCAQVMRF